MALHESPSSPPSTATVPDISTQVPIESSARTEVNFDAQQTTATTPVRSLFGPFPPSENLSQADQQHTDAIEPKEVTESPPPDRIEFSGRNDQPADQAILGFNSQTQEPPNPVQRIPPSNPSNISLPPLMREKTAPAIGPATDKPTPVPKESEVEGPVLFITLLLSSTGARHPYKLDEKYLRKRNVAVEGNNPINISLYKLKELILRDWREEWEAKPSSPESIRLISMGKLLNDKARLSDSGFTNGPTPHIIHMTIKPQEIVDEEDAKMKSGGSGRGENERSPGCRCIIQ